MLSVSLRNQPFLLIISMAIGLMIFSCKIVYGQNKGEGAEPDTIKSEAPVKVKDFRPRRATLMSAVLPGMGQAYNKKYWKIPILYALGGTIGYFLVSNQKYYTAFGNAYQERLDSGDVGSGKNHHYQYDMINKVDYSTTSTAQIKYARDYNRRNRDFTVILGVVLYMLNVLDAHVDAHLRTFEINDDLSMRIKPDINMMRNNNLYTGISFQLRLKK